MPGSILTSSEAEALSMMQKSAAVFGAIFVEDILAPIQEVNWRSRTESITVEERGKWGSKLGLDFIYMLARELENAPACMEVRHQGASSG